MPFAVPLVSSRLHKHATNASKYEATMRSFILCAYTENRLFEKPMSTLSISFNGAEVAEVPIKGSRHFLMWRGYELTLKVRIRSFATHSVKQIAMLC
jgi:hypothetical protein